MTTGTVLKADELPDSAFAYVEPGGAKDAYGKTAPRVLRHLPYKTAAGDVDLDLLAVALNAVPDTNLPRATQAKVAARLESVAARYAEPLTAGLAVVEKYITHEGGSWKVHAESGRVLGTHDSEAEAAAQLAAVEAGKHDKEKSEDVEKVGWTDEARAAAAAARAHGYVASNSEGGRQSLHHASGAHVLISPNGQWTHDATRTSGMSLGGREPEQSGRSAQGLRARLGAVHGRSNVGKGGGTVRWPVMPRPGGQSAGDAGEKAPNQKVSKEWSDAARQAAAAARSRGWQGTDNALTHPGYPGHSLAVGDRGYSHVGPGGAVLRQDLHDTLREHLDGMRAPSRKSEGKVNAPEWGDEAEASKKEAGKHGFEEELKTDAGLRMSHGGGTSLFVTPAGKWHHSDEQGEILGAGTGALKLGEHLGKRTDREGALPATPATTKPAEPAEPAVPGQPRPAPGKDPAFDKAYEDFKAQVKAAVSEAAGPGSRVVALVFDKDRYKKPAEASAWANDHGFEGKKVVETAGGYAVGQRNPAQLERKRTVQLTEGVRAVVGFPRKAVEAVRSAFFLTASGRLAFKRADVLKAECEPVEETSLGTVWRVRCAERTLHFAESGGAAAFMPAYEHLSKSTWVHVFKAEEQRYTLTVVYPASTRKQPNPDFHGDVMSPEELEKSAWGFMDKGTGRVGLMHRPGTAGAGKVVESYIWRSPEWTMRDTSGTEQSVSPGDWVMGIVWSPEAWAAIKGGQITGVSLQGAARKEAF